MPICCVKGCNSKSGREKLSFFCIPTIISRECEKTLFLSRRRRALWIERINRADLQENDIKVHTKVCSKHFVTGRPSKLFQENNPDWAPSLDLGPEPATRSKRMRKKTRILSKAKVAKKTMEEVDPLSLASVELKFPSEEEDAVSGDTHRSDYLCYPYLPIHNFKTNVGCQTDIALSELDHLYANYSRVLRDNIALRADVERLRAHIEDCPISKKERLGTEASHLKLFRVE